VRIYSLTVLVALVLLLVHQLQLLQVGQHVDQHAFIDLGDFLLVEELVELLNPLLLQVVAAG
jgi:hypothetical protein